MRAERDRSPLMRRTFGLCRARNRPKVMMRIRMSAIFIVVLSIESVLWDPVRRRPNGLRS